MIVTTTGNHLAPSAVIFHPPAPLSPQRAVFATVPKKPPGLRDAALLLLGTVSKNLEVPITKTVKVPRNGFNVPEIAAVVLPEKVFVFKQRPLQVFKFGARLQVHHSIILLMDGLLFACFRLRLERDACAHNAVASYCEAFGAGVSPASTFCGLFMPHPTLLRAVMLAVRAERGYGIFVGPVSSDAWCLIALPNSTLDKATLLLFTFIGPDGSSWKGIFCSFAYQGKVKRKKPDVCFDLQPIVQRHLPFKVGAIPFCPARISSQPFLPVSTDDTARRSPPLDVAVGIPRPCQNMIWNAPEMAKVALPFPNFDVIQLFEKAVARTGAPLLFVGDRTKRVVTANGDLEPEMLSQIRERFVSEVSKNRMMGPFERCPFPNDWCPHQPRSTPLDTRRKDKYDPLSTRFRVISNFSAGHNRALTH
jgi:hypothetical protein